MRVLTVRNWPPLMVALLTLLSVAAFTVGGPFDGTARAAPAGFIYREGTKLMLNGQQYKFAGLNADTWFGCWPNEVPTDAQLERYFSELNPRSMTRIFAFPNVNLTIMDQIVAAAERHGQYVAATLMEGGGECGIAGLDDAWYNGGFRGAYFDHIRNVVPRYKNSKAIGVWELINEPNGGHPNLKAFYRESSDLIKSLDPEHLVGSGSHQAGNDGVAKYTSDHDVPNVDLISMHEYDAATGLSHHAADSISAARALNKPWYAGEDGFCCTGGNTGSYPGNAAKLRDEWTAYLDQPESAGMLYWDFKLGHPETSTVNFDTPLWDLAKTFRHAYNGGTTTPPPTTPPPGGLLSHGKPATASSLEGPNLPASAAVDGNASTRWSSQFGDPQWIQVDLGATYSISRVVLSWETAHGRAYQVETSVDGATWAPVYSTTTGDGGVDDLAVTGTGRHVRMYGTTRGTEYGYSLWEFQVYGSGGATEPAPPPATVTVNDNTMGSAVSQFQYSSGWQYDSNSAGKYQNDDHYSNAVNSEVLFRFDGTTVKWFGAKDSHHGIAAVSIDGGTETFVDLYASSRSDQVLLYPSPTLPSGSHTLRIRVTGTKHAASSGTVIAVDKAEAF